MKRYRRREIKIFSIPKGTPRSKIVPMAPIDFRNARLKLNLTQDEMGRALGGYQRRSVAAWERGENDVPFAVEKLTKIFLETPKLVFFRAR